MNQIDKITLTIEAGAQTIRMDSEENGIRSSKLIGLDDLAGCFLRSKQQPMLHSGLLPPGCLSYSEGEEGECGSAPAGVPVFPLPGPAGQRCLCGGRGGRAHHPGKQNVLLPFFQCQRLPDVYRREYPAQL